MLLAGAGASHADFERPTLNLYGVTGAIDTPTALDQPEGELALTVGYFGNITRGTLSFQGLPAVQGAFRYTRFGGLNLQDEENYENYLDRSFDISIRLLKESRFLPAIKVGLQDFAGTGFSSAEYVVATKTFGDRLAVTAGLGWGRLGSYKPIGSLGERGETEVGKGGNFNIEEWFSGDVAPFASVIYRPTDRLTLLAEYSSDIYELEQGTDRSDRILTRDSPLNFGVTYRVNNAATLGAYYMYGSEIGVKVSFVGNPNRPPVPASVGPAPPPLLARPSRQAAPDKWVETWAQNPRTQSVLLTALDKVVEEQGLEIESFEVISPNVVEVRFRNSRYNANAQAVGRMARALASTMPASVETFRIVPSVVGLPASTVVIRRSDLEALVYAPNAAAQLNAVAGIEDARASNPGASLNPDMFPRFDWSIGPYAQRLLFQPSSPFRYSVGVRAGATYEPRPGVVLSGSVTKRLFGNLTEDTTESNSVLPKVRTDFKKYNEEGDPALQTLTAAYYFKPGPNLYGRVTAGYLERMFGGLSTELLWKPVQSRLGLGIELNYVKQREFDQQFGFRDYSVATGHVSAYYELNDKFDVRLDVGRYLAGDVGATLALSRVFDNGWRVSAFATKTDVSAEEFGEGSFDKGISVSIPVAWFTGRPTQQSLSTTLRPVTRDGGARLSVDGRLYGRVNGYHEDGLDDQWGRVWR